MLWIAVHLPQLALEAFAATRATLCIHLSIHVLERLKRELSPQYGEDCPVAELARREGISLSALKVRLLRLREILRGCIGKRLTAARQAETT
jgi:precorrin-4 methylase